MPYECPDCKRPFKKFGKYRTHATEEGHRCDWHFCNVCQAPFPNEHALVAHGFEGSTQASTTGSVSQPHRCSSCPLSFASAAALKVHRRVHATPSDPPASGAYGLGWCAECSMDNGSVNGLAQHYQLSPKHPNCPRCGHGMRNDSVLDTHMYLFHRRIHCVRCSAPLYSDEKQDHFNRSIKHPKCTQCQTGFNDESALNKHIALKHPAVACTQCNMTFPTVTALHDHYKDSTSHPICTLCTTGFADLDQYKEHTATRHPPKAAPPSSSAENDQSVLAAAPENSPMNSVAQGSASTGATKLEAALSFGSNCAEVKISSCAKLDFGSETDLKQHYRSSNDHRSCPQCSEGLMNDSGLATHMQLFHLTMPCSLCNALIHQDERESHVSGRHAHCPTCPTCDTVCADEVQMMQHKASEHVSVHCATCKRSYGSTTALQAHYRGSSSHPHCTRCKLGFADQSAYNEHMVKEHPPQPPRSSPPQSIRSDVIWVPSSSSFVVAEAVSPPSTPPAHRAASHEDITDPPLLLYAADSTRADTTHKLPITVCEPDQLDPWTDLNFPALSDCSLEHVSVDVPNNIETSDSLTRHRPSENEITASARHRAAAKIQRAWRHKQQAATLESLERGSRNTFSTALHGSTEGEIAAFMRHRAAVKFQRVWRQRQQPASVGQSAHNAASTVLRGPALAGTRRSSWHCRACRQDPCREPTTTVCGHIFCLNCIISALATAGQCPSCRRVILVRLHVEEA